MRILFLLLILVVFTSGSISNSVDKPYPKDYFSAPVKTTIRLSGTFGELRSNHFHMGIDIKGSIGVPLYAAAEGHVVRIKVQAASYGKVLYIAHPAGYTTVYAHMNRFTDELEDYVKQIQYEQEQFEVDLYPKPGQFSFERGERIGAMGTTGYSFGPHLHFEIRDSKTEKPINPLLFNFRVEDTVSPRMHQIKTYELDKKRRTLDSRVYDLQGQGKSYRISGDTIYASSNQVGLALKAYDHMNNIRNWNGLYVAELWVDDQLHYNYKMESISFDDTRYLNAHLDYGDQVSLKSYFNRLFALPGNGLDIYPDQIEAGIISLKTGRAARKIQMIAKDAAGNTTTLRFWLKRSNRETKGSAPDHQYLLGYDQAHEILTESLKVYIPKGALYEDLFMHYSWADREQPAIYSAIHHVHDYKTPVHKYIDIAIQPGTIPDYLRPKAFIAYIDQDGDIVNYGGVWEDGMLKAKVRDLGDFCIMVDEERPKIIPGYFKSNLKGASRMTFKMMDNYGTSGNTRRVQYRATVDGQWILMEYDAKNDLLFHRFDGRIPPGNHQLRIEVWDSRNNVAVLERAFSL